jgi:YgiT-type zinc finger domain-containing protein
LRKFSEKYGDGNMKETMIETQVTYTLAHGGKFYIIEYVPARVCQETGEHIQALIKGGKEPDRVVETPVYEYA